jgi:hypothetical protein
METVDAEIADPRLGAAVDDQLRHHGAGAGAELEAMQNATADARSGTCGREGTITTLSHIGCTMMASAVSVFFSPIFIVPGGQSVALAISGTAKNRATKKRDTNISICSR